MLSFREEFLLSHRDQFKNNYVLETEQSKIAKALENEYNQKIEKINTLETKKY